MLAEVYLHHGEIFGKLQKAIGVDIAFGLEREVRQMGETVVRDRILHLCVVYAALREITAS